MQDTQSNIVSQVSIIYIVLITMQIVSKQLSSITQGYTVSKHTSAIFQHNYVCVIISCSNLAHVKYTRLVY